MYDDLKKIQEALEKTGVSMYFMPVLLAITAGSAAALVGFSEEDFLKMILHVSKESFVNAKNTNFEQE